MKLAVVAIAAAMVAGCGGLPGGSSTEPKAATVVVTIGPKDTQEPLDREAIVICGGVRAVYHPEDAWVVLKNVPFGIESPPRQPLTVTARGYRTASQWVELNVTTATYVDVALEPVDLEQTGTVAGTVTDQETGKPIVNAHVTFRQKLGDQQTVVEGFTDADGGFIIGGIPIGRNQVVVNAAGYLEWSGEVVVAQDAGGENPELVVRLISGSTTVTVRGVVVDLASQAPIAGATVMLGEAQTTTGADGSFVFENVRVGSVTIRVTAEGYDDYEETLNIVPGMAELRIEMAEASPAPPPPPHNVTGKVTVRNRPDNSGARVSAFNMRLGLVMDSYTTGADGIYYLFVPPGEYELHVEYEGRRVTRRITVPGGGRVLSGIDFVISAPPR